MRVFSYKFISPFWHPKSVNVRGHEINPALIIIDVQNGFVSKGGSYDLLGVETAHYRAAVSKIAELIKVCRGAKIPIFYTQAVRERSGIDLLTKSHKMLPKAREERIRKRPICVRGTWDADIVVDIKPAVEDHVVVKRRDSAFQDTEINVWLESFGIDTLVFCGIDTSICVETSLRDGFNNGYDVILISDATASGNHKHFESTLEVVKEYYGIVMDIAEFASSATQKTARKA